MSPSAKLFFSHAPFKSVSEAVKFLLQCLWDGPFSFKGWNFLLYPFLFFFFKQLLFHSDPKMFFCVSVGWFQSALLAFNTLLSLSASQLQHSSSSTELLSSICLTLYFILFLLSDMISSSPPPPPLFLPGSRAPSSATQPSIGFDVRTKRHQYSVCMA